MAGDEAEKANIAAKEARRTADEPTPEPTFEPLVNTMHEDAKDNDELAPMSLGMAERIKREQDDKS
jgi:hypothetical protein